MEFIQKMKKREFIEMGLKTLAALLACFVAIILMEGMIYGITLNSYMKNGSNAKFQDSQTIAYCIEVDEDQYFVLAYNEEDGDPWSAAASDLKTKAECEALTVKEVVYHAPNSFRFTITAGHYVVMAIVVAAVVGFFVYRFIALAKEYNRIEDNFNKTGEIEISNM